jgi:polyisoprenoid-binding protein YceI
MQTMKNWISDKAHTEIDFSVRHMMISTVRGGFNDFQITVTGSPEDPESMSGYVEIKTSSVDTREDQRNNHLRSPDFFNSEKYPNMTFRSTKVSRIGENRYKIEGDLTIRDVTKRIDLEGEFEGTIKDPYGKERMGFTVTGIINRKDFGLQWNFVLEGGGVMVGDKVNITIHAEVVAQ